jgi:23S rRNA (pseudouridine1915-N3)-methyltransferase
MFDITLIVMGKLKEKFYLSAAAEYEKRLSRFGKWETIELPDLPEPSNSSPAIEEQIKKKEGEAILSKIRDGDVVVCLCIDGKQMDSVQLSRKMTELIDTGRRVVFVIGGSLGLSDEVIRRADQKLSFSNLTFPHPLMRVVLLEQLYRAERIRTGERYHK